jgi:hypothetical protein
MKIYVYSLVSNKYVDLIEGVDNKDCESQAEEKWGDDYAWTYSPCLITPQIGDFMEVS